MYASGSDFFFSTLGAAAAAAALFASFSAFAFAVAAAFRRFLYSLAFGGGSAGGSAWDGGQLLDDSRSTTTPPIPTTPPNAAGPSPREEVMHEFNCLFRGQVDLRRALSDFRAEFKLYWHTEITRILQD